MRGALLVWLLAHTWAQTPQRMERVAILPVISEGPYGQASFSGLYGASATALEGRVGLLRIPYEEMFVAREEGLVNRVRDCGADAGCIASRMRMFNARLGLVTVVNLDLDPPLLAVMLFDTDRGDKIDEKVEELQVRKEPEIVARATEVAAMLLEAAGHRRAGKLMVHVTPPNAVVQIKGGPEADRGAPNIFTLPAGTYEIQASLAGWRPQTAQATITDGERKSLDLQLQEDVAFYQTAWSWVPTTLVVAASVVTGIVLATRGEDRCYVFDNTTESCR